MVKRVGVVVAIVALTGVVLAPADARADRRGNGRPGPPKLHHTLPHHFKAPHHHHHHGGPYSHVRPYNRYGASPIYVTPYYDPWLYAPAPVYAPPPVVYTPPPPVYVPPPSAASPPPAPLYEPGGSGTPGGTVSVAPPMSTVVEFPTGRYELRGDGISTPYQWVWVPNAPPAPPGGPATSAPAPPPAPRETKIVLYRWVDTQGAVHWTDRYESVPEQYRKQATKH